MKSSISPIVMPAQLSDLDDMVALSKVKRREYEKAQPQFWRYNGEDGDRSQRRWFQQLFKSPDYAMFTAIEGPHGMLGFVIGRLVPAPEVYNPGGFTLMIDDFCVSSETRWESVGGRLIEAITGWAKARGAVQILVVCGAHDDSKRLFLHQKNLSIASEWFVGGIA